MYHHSKAKTLSLTTPTDPHTVPIADIKANMHHIHTSIVSRHLTTRGNNKILRTPHHTLAVLKTYFPDSLVTPLPNSEQINHTFSNHTHTKSTPNHIHHHYAPLVTNTHTIHIISRWTEYLAGGPQSGRSDSQSPFYPHPLARVKGGGRQLQHRFLLNLVLLLAAMPAMQRLCIMASFLKKWKIRAPIAGRRGGINKHNTFLERSFIYAAPCEWNKLSECIRTSTFDSFRKSVKTMLFTQQYGC